ncbi:MAG: hypothetical protein AAB568_00295 [Patescibacteria group bacterium]
MAETNDEKLVSRYLAGDEKSLEVLIVAPPATPPPGASAPAEEKK